MKNFFFITGLPRSRTAWLSNFMTHGRAFCWHDLIKEYCFQGLCNVRQMVHDMQETSRGIEFLGDSDSALVLVNGILKDLVPKAKWVFVKRDAEACVDSFAHAFRGTGYPGSELSIGSLTKTMEVGRRQYEISKIITGTNGIEVAFEDLDKKEVVQKIWEHCLPGEEFPEERFALLNTFKVEIIPSKVLGNIRV